MQYERFLDVHLVSSKIKPNKPIVRSGTGRYQYDFKREFGTQKDSYTKKHGSSANSWSSSEVLGSVPIKMPNLEPLHYISCYCDLESLRPAEPLIPELTALVEWVSATQNRVGAPTRGKLRLNCHGSQVETLGFVMGRSNLSPEHMVDALIRHGLAKRKRAVQTDELATNVAHRLERKAVAGGVVSTASAARWKADAEVNACENKKCSKVFGILRRKHHCRRCGGIFCDGCTTSRMALKNPLTETGRATGMVQDCRVCDDCRSKGSDVYAFTPVQVGIRETTGLVQITLAMCLTARDEREFATAKTGFARNSTAAKFVAQLSLKGAHGIQVSGSNEVLKGTTAESFGVKYPGISKDKEPSAGPAYDPFEGTGWAGADLQETSLEIPCSILGSRGEPNPDPDFPSIVSDAKFASVRDQVIVPIQGGNKMAFGIWPGDLPQNGKLIDELARRRWQFRSWRIIQEPVGRIAELTRVAGGFTQSALGASVHRTAHSTAAAFTNSVQRSAEQLTIVIDAPQRRMTIRRNPKDPNTLIVSGFEERRYKDFKVYQVS
jgi:hypothetical protein